MKVRSGRRRAGGALIAVLATLALLVSPLTTAPAQAANPTAGFNAGEIISDSLFYERYALDPNGIQAFLERQVTNPTSKSLQNYRTKTTSKAANAFCRAYNGKSSESAAVIISKVGSACGVSQKALLVMLQKETSLVGLTSPEQWRYDRAMGYACPDTGPGGTANCNTSYYGFFNQMYNAAKQLKRYGVDSTFNWFPVGKNSNIQYNVPVSCGTKNVRIVNKATAALYYYTPYTPNAASLSAGWGTGNGCSSYGNRNFYSYYKAWFGSPTDLSATYIDSKYAQNQWLGEPTSDYNFIAESGGGTVRAYQNGAIALRAGTKAAAVLTGDFRTYFGTQGGIAGYLGWPTGDQSTWEQGRTQGFQGGAMSHHPKYGFAVVQGMIRSHYGSQALAYSGPLGWPTSNQTCTSSANCTQDFEHGTISSASGSAVIRVPEIDAVAGANKSALGNVTRSAAAIDAHGGGLVQAHAKGAIAWSKTHGAHTVMGSIRTAFGAAGGVQGDLGWPTSDQVCHASGICEQSFLGGAIQVDQSGRVSTISAEVLAAYDSLLGAGIDLGKSLGSTNQLSGGSAHPFENGAIAFSSRTGAFAVTEPIRGALGHAGGLTGALGWPTGNARFESANGGGTVQGFEGGAIVHTDTGVYVLTGEMRASFSGHGGLTGELGWPESDWGRLSVNGGGALQLFQGGGLYQPGTRQTPILVGGSIFEMYEATGGARGKYGWPTADAREEPANGGGLVQGFQNAAIVSSESGTYSVTGEIRRYYGTQGGLLGTLGWPTSAVTSTNSEERQSFQGGTIVRNLRTGLMTIEK